MANKQTKRERRDTAKKERLEQQMRAARRRRMRTIRGGAVVALALALVVFLIVNSGKGGRQTATKLNTLATAAGCTAVQSSPNEGRGHVDAPATVQYKTNPPTSGDHYSGNPQTAFTGVHASPVQNELQVHNLEHGHVGIQYQEGKLPAAVKTALEDFVRDHDRRVFMAPKPDLPANVALAFNAWRNLSTCATPGQPADVVKFADAFLKRFKGSAPENFDGTPIG